MNILSDKDSFEGNFHLLKTYICYNCGKVFNTKQALQNHFRTHTGEKPFICITCGKSFRQKIHLKRHVTVHTGQKPFRCSYCGKVFSRKDHLKTHKKTCQIHIQSQMLD